LELRCETLEQRELLATFSVTNTNDSGAGSLRQAIIDSDSTSSSKSAPNVISFNIPGAGVHTIAPLSPFAWVEEPVVIDGSSQPGFSGQPLVEIDGENAGPLTDGFLIGTSATVQDLVINRFSGAGVALLYLGSSAASDSVVRGNFIGTDPTGTHSVTASASYSTRRRTM
jgi:hypothetical protein